MKIVEKDVVGNNGIINVIDDIIMKEYDRKVNGVLERKKMNKLL
jgi:hypothetical protein